METSHQKMKNITIALPEKYLEKIQTLQEYGMVPSRSEAIRLALRDFLKRELYVCELFDYDLHQAKKEHDQ